MCQISCPHRPLTSIHRRQPWTHSRNVSVHALNVRRPRDSSSIFRLISSHVSVPDFQYLFPVFIPLLIWYTLSACRRKREGERLGGEVSVWRVGSGIGRGQKSSVLLLGR